VRDRETVSSCGSCQVAVEFRNLRGQAQASVRLLAHLGGVSWNGGSGVEAEEQETRKGELNVERRGCEGKWKKGKEGWTGLTHQTRLLERQKEGRGSIAQERLRRRDAYGGIHAR
jgi:hypothetical protein